MLESQLTSQIKMLIKQALNDMGFDNVPAVIHLENPIRVEFGDYSSNVAMTLDRPEALKSQSPREVAAKIVAQCTELLTQPQFKQLSQHLSHITTAGPGFINFYVSEHFLMAEIDQILKKRSPVVLKVTEPKSAVIEYSSPNIAKPFTVGHLRSTIIGDAVANILEAVGYKIYRDNHVGDWGTQFGKLVYAIKTWGDEKAIAASDRPIKELVELYVKFHQEAENDPSLEDEGRAWFTRLETGDPEARRLWKLCIEWSWVEFLAIYRKLGITFTEHDGRGYGESFFEDKMDPIIEELKTKKLLQNSEGAQLVFFPEESLPPLMILKKDGSTLYATRDLATDKFRLDTYGPETVIINEVGAEQALYFQQLFKLEEMLGWYKPGQRVHVKHGLYRFKEGKMSTRKGNVIWLEDILDEAFIRVKNQANAESKLSDDEIWKIAIAAVKWQDLKRESKRDIVFNYDEMLSLQGNTGPYMQYTYVRCRSIMSKAPAEVIARLSTFDTSTYSYTDKERVLASTLTHFGEVVAYAAMQYQPHHVCTYLHELAQAFNSFYAESLVLGDSISSEAQAARLKLVECCAITIQLGLELLGIDIVEKM